VRRVFGFLIMAFVLLFGSAVGEYAFSGDPSVAHQHVSVPIGDSPHPPGLPTIWKGRNVTELVGSLGEPDLILETTVSGIALFGDTYAVSYVYFPGLGSGGQCYIAYVVEHDSGEILAYHCR
jgi:hypothetical protein